jgi:hypothetical protein
MVVFFHEFAKEETPQNKKPCARLRDAGRVAASASGDPAMVSGFRMASILSRKYHGHLARFAQRAGLLLDALVQARSPRETVSRFLRTDPKDMTVSALCPCASSVSMSRTKPEHESIMQKRAPNDARVFH